MTNAYNHNQPIHHPIPDVPSSYQPLVPSAFNALSSICNDQLVALEQDAAHHGNLDTRHIGLREEPDLRRMAETATSTKQNTLLDTPFRSDSHFACGAFPASPHRNPRYNGSSGSTSGEDDPVKKVSMIQRRTGNPALQMTPMSSGSFSSSQIKADASSPFAFGQRSARESLPHPFKQPANPHALNHPISKAHNDREDSPSLMSSDSESLPRSASRSPSDALLVRSHFSSHLTASDSAGPGYIGCRTSDMNFTPLTSPVLGPLRTLKLQSAAPSRVSSPTPLPLNAASCASPEFMHSSTDDTIIPYTPRSSKVGQFDALPNSDVLNRVMAKRKMPGTDETWSPATAPLPPRSYLHAARLVERSLPPLRTPQLSSGPSSPGSSPKSFSQSTGVQFSGSFPHTPRSGHTNGTLSVASSRAPSPSPWPYSTTSSRHRRVGSSGGLNTQTQTHHHIAQSVRVAFGIPPANSKTTWNPAWRYSQPGSHSHSGVITPFHFSDAGFSSSSMPGSRSGSPPITLPPLKLPRPRSSHTGQAGGMDDGVVDDNSGRVELPGFREFEAATLVPL